jgi:uncharacterized protein YndB with AHSA1/START domain
LKFWFAEQAALDPVPDGGYAFWGKHTLWGRAARVASQTLVAVEQPQRLSFRWPLRKQITEVTYSLFVSDGGTRLHLAHDLVEGDLEEISREMIADFWCIAMINLLWHIETGAPMRRFDYTKTSGNIAIDFEIGAPPSQIFQALTLPARMDAWLSHRAKVELRIGGCYSFGWTHEIDGKTVEVGPTNLLELEQDKRIAYGWHWPGETPDTLVGWDLISLGKGSRVELRHTGFAGRRDSTDYTQGWTAFFCKLKLYLERGVQWE